MRFANSEKSILLVDDEVDLREILQYDLEDAGYRVFTACNALVALSLMKQNHIDLVVSDIRMPDGDGLFLLESLREKNYQDPPIILMSGFADITPAEAYNRGVVKYLSKPLATEFLLNYIEDSLLDPMERWKKKSEWNEDLRFERTFNSLDSASKDNLLLLGKGGLFLNIRKDLPRLQSDCYFKFTFQNTQSILEGIGTCKWQRNLTDQPHLNGVGIEFKELTDSSIVFINKYAQEQKLIPYIPMKTG